MTIDEINIRIRTIKMQKEYDDIAHEFEDQLYYDFIKSISMSKKIDIAELKQKAKLITSTRKIKFSRWYS